MHTMTHLYTDAEAQWATACDTLGEEFHLSAQDLPSIETAKSVFLHLVGRRELSQEAVNALMYSLYFSGYLTMLASFKQQSPDFEVPEYLHTHPVLEAANRWAMQAVDGHLLAQLAQPIIRDTQELLDALN
jgi:hypothetical protein